MEERKFSLNDNILDGITFDEIVLMVKCNYEHINELAVLREFENLLKTRIKDAMFLLKNNSSEIVKIAEDMRNGE